MTVASLVRRCQHASARWLERTFFAELARRQHDQRALTMLAPLIDDYLPWTGSAMRPGGVRLCINEVVIHDRGLVLELGAGLSTVLLARVLAGRGGRLISVDHDPEWQQIVLSQCGASSRVVSCVHAPLTPVRCEEETYQWYDVDSIVAGLAGQRVDLLIVDGPVSSTGKMSRYPALPLLRPYLGNDAAIVLDDIERPDERRIAAAWAASSHRAIKLFGLAGGVGILQLSDGRRYNIA